MKFNSVFGLVLAVAFACPAAANVVLEGNGAYNEEQWGGELGIGYSIGAGGFALTPSVGAFLYQRDNDRYFKDDNGGNSRCRDSSNGQYADDEKCDNLGAKAYGRVEATYTVPASITFGLGARISNEVRPYATAAVPLGPRIQLKGNAGPHYYAAGLRVSF